MSGTLPTQTISNTVTYSVKEGETVFGGRHETGTVIVTDTGAVVVTSSSYAVFAPGGVVINYGLIFNAGAVGIQESAGYAGTNGLEENYGTVTGGETGIAMTGRLLNSGLIIGTIGYGVQGGSATIANTGEIYGGDIGVDLTRGSSTISNSGSIGGGTIGTSLKEGSLGNSGTIDGGATGVLLSHATINNTGFIYGGSAGLSISYSAPIINFGSIGGGVDGVDLGQNTPDLVNTGQISGGENRIYLRSGALDLTDAGTISGGADAIYVGNGALNLTVDPGAAFSGFVFDRLGSGQITLAAGTQAGSLDMNNTFIGFKDITFASGATWSLRGSTIELAGGEKIAGFRPQDSIVLEGFSATAENFVYGTGLVLSNATASETLALNTQYLNESFSLFTGGGNSTIVAEQAATPAASIISSLIPFQINPGSGAFSQDLTIEATGTVSSSTGPALLNGEYIPSGTIMNRGLIATGAGAFAINLKADTVRNSGTITGAGGVNLHGGELFNAGLISGTAADGVELDGAGFSNSGQIFGKTVGLLIDGNGSVVDSGTISGASDAIQCSGVLDLTLDPNADLIGAVQAGKGVLTLAGYSAGKINIASFSGFATIAFDTASIWTVDGNASQLAHKQQILGFAYGDTIGLSDFTATADVFSNNELILQDGNSLVTLDVVGSFSTGSFSITDNSGRTNISLINPATPAHAAIVTISEAPAMQFISPAPDASSAAETMPLNNLAAGFALAGQWHSVEFGFTASPFGHAFVPSGQDPALTNSLRETAALSAGVQSNAAAIKSFDDPEFAHPRPWLNY